MFLSPHSKPIPKNTMQFKALFSVSLQDFSYLINHLIDHSITNWLYTSDNELEVSGNWTYPISNICFNHREKVIRIEIEQDTPDPMPNMFDCDGIFLDNEDPEYAVIRKLSYAESMAITDRTIN